MGNAEAGDENLYWISQTAMSSLQSLLASLPVWTPESITTIHHVVAESTPDDLLAAAEEIATRLRDAMAVQAMMIATLTGDRDKLQILSGHHETRLLAANEYIAWLEAQLDAAG